MASFLDNIKKLPTVLGYLLVSLILIYIIGYMAWDIVGGWIPAMPDSLPILTSYRTFMILTFVILTLVGLCGPKPLNWLAGLGVVIMLVLFFSQGLEKGLSRIDRGINHGDWSAPSGYVRTVSGGTVDIAHGGFDRFYAKNTVRLRNKSARQCMHPRPTTPHTYVQSGNRYIVSDLHGVLIYRMSWSADGWTYTIELAPNRTELITVTTIELGQPDCRPARL